MDEFHELLEELRELRSWLLFELKEFDSGRVKHSERRGTEWVETTTDLTKEWRERLTNLDRLISKYEKRNRYV
jgi:hypothetical protein